jgi:hypothetical protein
MIAMETAHRIDVRRKALRNCLAAILAIASVPLISAGGLPPQTTIVSADATFTNDFDCSFPLQEQVKGTYRDTLRRDGVFVAPFFKERDSWAGRSTMSFQTPNKNGVEIFLQ